jgi:hypothetical protein
VVWEQTGVLPQSLQVQLPDSDNQFYQVEYRENTKIFTGKVLVQKP